MLDYLIMYWLNMMGYLDWQGRQNYIVVSNEAQRIGDPAKAQIPFYF